MGELKAISAATPAKQKPHIMDVLAVPLSLQLLLNEELSGRRRPAMVKSLQIAIELTLDMDCSEEHLG